MKGKEYDYKRVMRVCRLVSHDWHQVFFPLHHFQESLPQGHHYFIPRTRYTCKKATCKKEWGLIADSHRVWIHFHTIICFISFLEETYQLCFVNRQKDFSILYKKVCSVYLNEYLQRMFLFPSPTAGSFSAHSDSERGTWAYDEWLAGL